MSSETYKVMVDSKDKINDRNVIIVCSRKAQDAVFDEKGEIVINSVRGNNENATYAIITKSLDAKNNVDLTALAQDSNTNVNIYFVVDVDDSSKGTAGAMLSDISGLMGDLYLSDSKDYYSKLAKDLHTTIANTNFILPTTGKCNIYDCTNLVVGLDVTNCKSTNIKIKALEKDSDPFVRNDLKNALTKARAVALKQSDADILAPIIKALVDKQKGVVIYDSRAYSIYNGGNKMSSVQLDVASLPTAIVQTNSVKVRQGGIGSDKNIKMSFNLKANNVSFEFNNQELDLRASAADVTRGLCAMQPSVSGPDSLRLWSKLLVYRDRSREKSLGMDHTNSNKLVEHYNSNLAGQDNGFIVDLSYIESGVSTDTTKKAIEDMPNISSKSKIIISTPSIFDINKIQMQAIKERHRSRAFI